VLLTLLAAACGGPDLERLAEGERGRVALVRTGHTLVLEDGTAVRLAGVEAPRLDEPYGREARDALEDLALSREVRLLYGGVRRDDYGRALAHARVVGSRRWIQGELLAAGAVRVRTWADNRALAPEMYRIEAKARRDRRGLWADPAYQVLLPQETAGRGGFVVVEGRVLRTDHGWVSRLEFGHDWDDFAVEIPRRALADFEAAGLAPEVLQGRLVRVRGSLRRGRGGAAMRADHPEQIELLREP
jgi:endonuclease YncB( thermonuclease family)